MSINYTLNIAPEATIADFLRACDSTFIPPLSKRTEIDIYAKQIGAKAMRFEAWSGSTLVGLVAAYCNDRELRVAYITSVSVLQAWMRKGIAACLMRKCIEHARMSGMLQIRLEVARDNTSAIRLYEKLNFVVTKCSNAVIAMTVTI